MSPEQVAALYGARRVGSRRWMALCPAHRDRSPSLSIRAGRDGQRTILKCFAGCDTPAVLAARGLAFRDVRGGPSRFPAGQEEASEAAPAQDAGKRPRDAVEWSRCDVYRRLGVLLCSVGRRLAWMPEGDERLTALAHLTAELRCEAEGQWPTAKARGCTSAAIDLAASDAGLKAPRPTPAQFGPLWGFDWRDDEQREADLVMAEEELTCFIATGCAHPRTNEQNEEKARWSRAFEE